MGSFRAVGRGGRAEDKAQSDWCFNAKSAEDGSRELQAERLANGSQLHRDGPGTKAMKKPNREERQRMCGRKRRYRSQGDALQAAALLGLERLRSAYLCPVCGQWHLASRPRDSF